MSKESIKREVRKVLTEGKDDTYEYGCVMLYFDINSKRWKEVLNMIDKDDLYTEDGNVGYGFEDEPHVTILYGLHNDIPDSKVKEMCNGLPKVTITLDKISIFENDKYDVVKFDIGGDSKKELTKMNSKFSKLPHTTNFPEYHPHSTIAYVKKGKGKKYIKTLKGDNVITVTPDNIVYSKADNTEKKYKLNE